MGHALSSSLPPSFSLSPSLSLSPLPLFLSFFFPGGQIQKLAILSRGPDARAGIRSTKITWGRLKIATSQLHPGLLNQNLWVSRGPGTSNEKVPQVFPKHILRLGTLAEENKGRQMPVRCSRGEGARSRLCSLRRGAQRPVPRSV